MPTTPYEETAGTRPRVRRDVLFTQTPKGVIFHNADGGFQVGSPSAYRFATLLVPHLDGSRTVAEICEGFKEPQKAMVGSLVKALYARGFARPVPDPVEGARPWNRRSPPVSRSRSRMSTTTRTVPRAGSPPSEHPGRRARRRPGRPLVRPLPGPQRLRLRRRRGRAGRRARHGGGVRRAPGGGGGAHRRGSPAEVTVLPDAGSGGAGGWDAYAGYDVVVAAAGRDAFGTSLALLDRGVPEGRLCSPPGPSAGGWWSDRPARRTPRAVWPARPCGSARRGRGGGGRPVERTRPEQAGILGEFRDHAARPARRDAREPARVRGVPAGHGGTAGRDAGQVLLQDTASFDVLAERLLPHPRCPFCRTPAAAAEPVDLAEAAGRPAFRPVVAAAPEDGATEGRWRTSTGVRSRSGRPSGSSPGTRTSR